MKTKALYSEMWDRQLAITVSGKDAHWYGSPELGALQATADQGTSCSFYSMQGSVGGS